MKEPRIWEKLGTRDRDQNNEQWLVKTGSNKKKTSEESIKKKNSQNEQKMKKIFTMKTINCNDIKSVCAIGTTNVLMAKQAT